MSKISVLWLTNIPSPYRVEFFNELGKHCELTVLFETKISKERDKSWQSFNVRYFKAVFLHGKRYGVAEAFCPGVIRFLKKNKYDHIVITNYSDYTGLLAVAFLRLRRIPYEIEGDGAFLSVDKCKHQRIKHWVISSARICFSTSKNHDEYYLANGAPKERIFRYPFTSVREEDLIDLDTAILSKADARRKLGILEPKVVLAVGQFIERKGFDLLIKAAVELRNNVLVYIVGGTPPAKYEKEVAENPFNNVRFISFQPTKKLALYYKSADVFVHPTREDIWGLVINEAMAYSLPIVTTSRCNAGLELIANGQNGYIVPVEDVKALAEAIKKILPNSESMGRISRHRITLYTIEKMSERHIEIWKENSTANEA